eukprot:768591-Hanusia_phi.AAC.1
MSLSIKAVRLGPGLCHPNRYKLALHSARGKSRRRRVESACQSPGRGRAAGIVSSSPTRRHPAPRRRPRAAACRGRTCFRRRARPVL